MSTDPEIVQNIGHAMQRKLDALTYPDTGKKIFKKTLLGFDEQKIKVQGDGVVAITYATGATDFLETFGRHNVPHYIRSVVAFVIRGTSQEKYDRATIVMDHLLDLFQNDPSFYRLEEDGKRIVRDTDILNADLTAAKITGNKHDTVCVFTLRHHVFK